MAKASFYINDVTVRCDGDYLVLEARKKCQHGTVFDEVFLTLPKQLAHLFTRIEGMEDPSIEPSTESLLKQFRRFSTDN